MHSRSFGNPEAFVSDHKGIIRRCGLKNFKKLLENNWAAYTMATCSAVLLFLFLSNLNSFLKTVESIEGLLSPIIIGAVLAYLLNPIVVFFEGKALGKIKKEKTRYTSSVLLAVVCFIAALSLFFLALIPSLVDSVSSLAANMGSYVSSSQDLLMELDQFAAGFKIDITELTDSISDALNNVMGNVPALLNRVLSASVNMGSALFNIGIGFILAVYFLMGKSGILKAIGTLRRAALTEETYEQHTAFLTRCHNILIRYIGCNILDAFIIGLINAVFMFLTGMAYVPLISLVVGVTNLLPTFGPIIGGVIGGFILVLINPMHALIFIIFTLILQTFDGYILKPKLFGESLGVSAVMILITIILGGKIFGVIGILLAIPFAAIMTFVYDEAILPGLERRKKLKEKMKRESLDDGETLPEGGSVTRKQQKEAVGADPADCEDAVQELPVTEKRS